MIVLAVADTILETRVGQFDFRPSPFFEYNSACVGRILMKLGTDSSTSQVEVVPKFGVDRTTLTMRVELGSNL